MQAFYDNKPSKYEAVGNGSYLYRYNIQEQEQTDTQEESAEETRKQWSCEEVTVWSPVSSNKITQAVIADRWDSDYEQKLVNEYNGAQLGVYTDEEAEAIIAKYKAFLTERAELKKTIDADCEELGIR